MTRVLVVHHDLDVCDIETDALRRAGYEVDQCAGPIGGGPCPVMNGQRCWQVDLADVLVYDSWAAGDGDRELIDDVRELHPDKPIVLTSQGLVLDWVETDGAHRVTPYHGAPTGAGLIAAVEAAVKAGPPARTDSEPRAVAHSHLLERPHAPRW
jgi:DNA-binding NtrC family response regulator